MTAPSGVSPITSADHYTYNAPAGPAVTGVSPNFGTTAGGVGVYIYGSGFTGATAVSFGGSSAPFSVMSGTEIEAEAPAHAAGVVNVVVTGPGGSSSTSSADQYDYLAPPAPTVTGVSPNSGPTTGGGSYVTISGSGFYGPNGASDVTSVSFGGTASGMFDVMNGGVIDAYAPAHAAGTVDVTVTTTNGIRPPSSGRPVHLRPHRHHHDADQQRQPLDVRPIHHACGNGLQRRAGNPTGRPSGDPGRRQRHRDGNIVRRPGDIHDVGPDRRRPHLSAAYQGDGVNAVSTSNMVNLTVQQASTTTTLTSSADPSTFGQAVTLTVEVDGRPAAPRRGRSRS